MKKLPIFNNIIKIGWLHVINVPYPNVGPDTSSSYAGPSHIRRYQLSTPNKNPGLSHIWRYTMVTWSSHL